MTKLPRTIIILVETQNLTHPVFEQKLSVFDYSYHILKLKIVLWMYIYNNLHCILLKNDLSNPLLI